MAIMRLSDMKALSAEDLHKKARDLKLELAKERGKTKVGGVAENPGRVREVRRTLARIETILAQRKMAKAKESKGGGN